MDIDKIHIQKIIEGDESSFRLFVDLFSKDLYFFALSYVHIREIAEEIVSDVFFIVWKNRIQLAEIQNIKSWLLVLVRNKAISYLRKEDAISVIPYEEIDDYYIPSMQSPDSEIISQEEIMRINQSISKLPPKCKQVFLLAKIEGMPYKEIAEMLGISIKTINIHIAKALSHISEILRK